MNTDDTSKWPKSAAMKAIQQRKEWQNLMLDLHDDIEATQKYARELTKLDELVALGGVKDASLEFLDSVRVVQNGSYRLAQKMAIAALQAGNSITAVAKALNLHRMTITKWRDQWLEAQKADWADGNEFMED